MSKYKFPERESKLIEFKSVVPNFEKLITTCIAFANVAGGKIIIGVDDESREVVGVTDKDRDRIYIDDLDREAQRISYDEEIINKSQDILSKELLMRFYKSKLFSAFF